MSKSVKIAIGGLLAVLVLGVVAAGVLVAKFDAEHWKGELARRVQEHTGRELVLGQLALSVYPNIGLQVDGLSLSEPLTGKTAANSEFLAVAQARVSVQLLPLFSARLIADEIELKGLRAHIVRDRHGRFNFADLEALSRRGAADSASSPNPPNPSSAPGSEQLVFDIAGLRIADAKISYRDEASGRELVASRLSLTTGRLGQTARGKLHFATTLEGVMPTLAGQTHLAADYQFDLPRRELRFDKLEFRLNGHLASLQEADVNLSLAQLMVRLTDQAASSLSLSGLSLAARGNWQGEAADIKLNAPQFDWDGVSGGGKDVHLQARLAGKGRQADIKLDLAGLRGAAAQLDMQRVSLQIDAREGEKRLKGELATPLVWRARERQLQLPSLEGAMEWVDPAWPARQLTLPLTGEASGQWPLAAVPDGAAVAGKPAAQPLPPPAQLALTLNSSLEGGPVRLVAKLHASSIPALDFELDMAQLNLDRYRPVTARPTAPAGQKVTQAANQGAAATLPGGALADPAAAETPLNLDWLHQVKLSGVVRVGEVQASGLKLSALTLRLLAEKGRLELAPYSARLYQGQLEGRLRLDAGSTTAGGATHQLQFAQQLRGIAINPLLQAALQRDAIEGRGNLDFDLRSQGMGPQAWRQQLQGKMTVNLQDGAIKGFNLAQSLRETKALLSGQPAVAVNADAGKKTDFSELKASFVILNGVADNRDLSLKAPLLRIAGAGQIDLGRETLDYLAKASVVNTAKGQGGKDLAHLRGLTIPLHLFGSFAAPEWKLDTAGLLQAGAKQALSSKVEEKLEKQLGDKASGIKALKGLFGR